jgi:chemotaxis family two-component system sensor kinase Cph1
VSTTRPSPTPAFGQADLSNCEREQIQHAGSIQPHGALLLVRETDGVVVQTSANASEFLDLGRNAIGCTIDELGGDLAKHLKPILRSSSPADVAMMRCKAGREAREFDVLAHHPTGGGLLIEFERATHRVDLSKQTETALQSIVASSSLHGLCEQTASIFKSLTGYDRVMVYRFDEDGHGEVVSERKEAHLEAYLGNRYPASDIPQIARRLYERTRVRVLVDVEYQAIPLVPRLCPLSGQDLDMSLCFLRSMSPIHIQYLKNMGVGATLVASLVVGGKLWGLVACHHYVPRNIPFECRAACELLVEAVSIRIAALESVAQAQAEISVRRLEQRMIEAISQHGDWRTALFDNSQALLQPVGANGSALLFEGQVLTAGEVPGTQQLRDISRWLDEKPRETVVATSSLGQEDPRFAPLVSFASGLLAAPVSNTPGEYLLWFRPELVRTLTWGGNPSEPVIVGDDPSDLSPRRSFAKWHQLVEGKSESWSPADITVAKLIGETVSDVVLQFRSVRMLIARDQLEKITHQVQTSEVPVVVADPRGRILLHNQQFEDLLPKAHAPLQRVECLAEHFVETEEAKRRLRELVDFRRTWRGEITIRRAEDKDISMLVRGDPIFSSPDRVLGIVFLFTDITDRKVVEAAGREFQHSVIESHRVPGINLGTRADLIYQRLYSSAIENAQLAVLEITDGADKSRMVRMLAGVRASVDRTAEILDRLILRTIRSKPLK